MPHLAGSEGSSGGGRGMGSYQPSHTEVTGSLPPPAPPPPPPPAWTWEGGRPITVAPGETLEIISQRYGVPVTAIMQANSITSPAMVRPGQHLVIPRYQGPAVSAPQTRLAANTPSIPSAAPVGPPRTALAPKAGVHVVAPGETLHSIARLYGKSVMMIAKANNISPATMVKIGDRIAIPGGATAVRTPPPAKPATPAPVAAQTASAATAAPPSRAAAPVRAAGPAPVPVQPAPMLATAESPHSARLAAPAAPPSQGAAPAPKTTETVGSLPAFRWPVRGRIIAAFGPKPNGLQNDGINLAVPEGTPIKAAEDGVVAYAGDELKGYGNLVLVRHSNGFVTAYAHASELLVKRGDTVKRGQIIARSGQTGNVTAPQLHFEIRKGATPVDPAQYLNGA